MTNVEVADDAIIINDFVVKMENFEKTVNILSGKFNIDEIEQIIFHYPMYFIIYSHDSVQHLQLSEIIEDNSKDEIIQKMYNCQIFYEVDDLEEGAGEASGSEEPWQNPHSFEYGEERAENIDKEMGLTGNSNIQYFDVN